MSSGFSQPTPKRSLLQQWRQRVSALPQPQAEESIVLRVLIQVLVTIGITSVAVAAAGVTQTSSFNLLAIPLSAVGAYWSWRRRRQKNIATKFCIAIGMLLALAFFFSRLLGSPGDTRIILAELLIHLQVLHSFDLPRRKDLGYSMIIGLILIGVAGTVSQTLAFGPLLLLFCLVALPVLALDYQSQLGLLRHGWHSFKAGVSLRQLWGLTFIVLALGLIIFALLPRLPGYQIRSFPISSTVEFDGEFNGNLIVNPGYVSQGEGTEGNGSSESGGDFSAGQTAASGPGELDDTYYYGFNQTMNQNLRGRLTPQVVMRVRSQAEGFWRVLAFDRYTGQGWEISRDDEAETLQRSSFAFQTYIPRLRSLARDREIIQTYTITATLPNLIPALYQPEELYFPTAEVAIDPEGSLRSPVSLEEGMTYTVVSEVPYRDRTLLGQAKTQYEDSYRQYYLQVPEPIRARVRQQTEALLARSPNPLNNPYEKALFLAQALKQNYSVQPELPFFEADEDLVEAFLFDYEGGYPDHFSTVLTVMLRSVGIPARLVAGFGPGEFNPFTGFYVVQNTDAYAMTEVYFPDYGWYAFDPIPGHPLIPPSIEDSQVFSALRRFWNWVAGWLPSPVAGWLNGVFATIGRLVARSLNLLSGLFRQGWVGLFLAIALLLSLGFVGWLSWRGWRSWRRQRWLQKLPLMESLYQQMVDWLTQQGYPKTVAQTPLEYVQSLGDRPDPQRAQIIQEISQAYVRWRYGQESQNEAYLSDRLKRLQKPQRPRQTQ
ncbi:transglutaminase TgpA family protein [Almyronema epifaneia]|uniref:DUF3488 and DUF4129 domain-containing transglutaminase family protein n=1 Tax=Almyronema epifaneia S1 TaxID=2991925 RepID=A0ABW6IB64_9CYAN